jgi:D-amino-acid oxidase
VLNRPDPKAKMQSWSNDKRKLESCDVIIAGGGITGITTALVLQALGYRPAIISEYVPQQTGKNPARPFIPTEYAMASAYPHNLRVDNLQQVSDDSQKVFNYLLKQIGAGVDRIRMYEVFEEEPEEAPLGDSRLNFQVFDGKPADLKDTVNPPVRPQAEHIWGWAFDTYFADMPLYLPYLLSLFTERGGLVQNERLSLENLSKLSNGRPIVNCLGIGAIDVFGDLTPAVMLRGRQVLAPGAPFVTSEDDVPIAYNYTPTAEVFSRADGKPEYVHFFSRSDGWLLGQTREPGFIDNSGRWVGAAVTAPEITLEKQSIPAPIIELNDQILQSWVGYSTQGRSLIGREGYRYYRDPATSGVRLEAETIDGALLIHNYGHGGSGITMSWGCSLQVARLLLEKQKPAAPGHRSNANFDYLLADLL